MNKELINPESIKGHLFIVVAPSGAGKSTLIEYVRSKMPELHFPVSVTTREPRAGEVEGQDYYYTSTDEFERRIKAGDFLEYAHVHGLTYYGTLISEVVVPLQAGQNVIRHLDYQGVSSVRALLPADKVHVIYIDAGNWKTLLDRITLRSELDPDEIERRHQSYLIEEKFKTKVDKIVSNQVGEQESAQQELLEYVKEKLDAN